MKQRVKSLAAAGCTAVALAVSAGISTNAEATFQALICDTAACSGVLGTNYALVTDGGAGDGTPGIPGSIIMSFAFGPFTLLVNTSQSKPLIGSATSPQLDITFTVTHDASATAATVWMYAIDTGFTGLGTLTGTVDGNTTANLAGESEQIGIFGGNNNLNTAPGSFPGALLGLSGVLSGSPFHGSFVTGSIGGTVNPYELTAMFKATLDSAGTTTGDYNVHQTPGSAPEPATLALLGLGLAGLGFARRKRA